MEFYNRSKYNKGEPSPAGEKEVPTYTLKIDEKTGKEELKQTGTTNIYELIQASKDECDVYNILKRYEAGNVEILNQRQGVYADMTKAPTSLAQAQQMLLDAEQDFYMLPVEIRKEFNNSPSEYISAISNGEADKIFDKYRKNDENNVKIGENMPNNENMQSNGISPNQTEIPGVKYE